MIRFNAAEYIEDLVASGYTKEDALVLARTELKQRSASFMKSNRKSKACQRSKPPRVPLIFR